jgi:nucleoside-diphosphate-sugar epimerase
MRQSWLVTGSTGYVGSSLIKKLSEYSPPSSSSPNIQSVFAASRTPPITALRNVQYLPLGDLSSGDIDYELSRRLNHIDVVVHTAALVHTPERFSVSYSAYLATNVTATLALANAAANAGVKRFIFISTVGVHGQFSLPGHPFTEISPTRPYNFYTRSKLEAEQKLADLSKSSGIDLVLIRPPMIYGPNAPGNFGALVRAIRAGLPLPFGSLNNKRTFLYIQNLLDFIIFCGVHPHAAGNTFLVSDDCDVSTTELIKLISFSIQKEPMLLPVNPLFLKLVAFSTGQMPLYRKLCSPLQIDNSLSNRLLGWSPPFSTSEAISLSLGS